MRSSGVLGAVCATAISIGIAGFVHNSSIALLVMATAFAVFLVSITQRATFNPQTGLGLLKFLLFPFLVTFTITLYVAAFAGFIVTMIVLGVGVLISIILLALAFVLGVRMLILVDLMVATIKSV